ncbi:hypothetical protein GN956_G4341 [Arapaima gigas]
MGLELKRVRAAALPLLSLLFVPWLCLCTSVTFRNIQQPLHVVLNDVLVLEAEIQNPKQQFVSVTWEREAESGTSLGKVKVAEFPGKNIDSRIAVENNGATLKVHGFCKADCGVYTVTMTTKDHTSVSANCLVKEYEAVHHVTVSINVSHTTLLCKEAWGTDPTFRWLHEKAQISDEVGRPSADGQVLYLSSEPCGHFTCVVSNRLGQSSATYTAEPCERRSSGTAVAVAFLVILLISCALLAFLMWRRQRRYLIRRERLTEPF